jgi:NitT/TauT family transport system substrate-binding protein
MRIMQSRRGFAACASAAGVASLIGGRPSRADEEPPETTTVRLAKSSTICFAPMYVMDELLRAEGFTDIQHVPAAGGFIFAQAIAGGEIDFGASFAGSVVYHLDAGLPITTVGCVHAGCYELFAHEPIHTISDLKGRRISIQTLASSGHLYLAVMAAHVGLDPQRDIEWVESGSASAMELFAQGKTDAFLGFPPEPQELRARKIGRVILSTATDRPWSQYLCCMLVSNRKFVRAHPVATKRVLRALLKAADFCAANPAEAARLLVEGGFTERYDYALQTLSDIPYTRWRDYDAEDTMRYFALRLHEVGMIRTSPNKIITEGTDWRFLNEIKHELKA